MPRGKVKRKHAAVRVDAIYELEAEEQRNQTQILSMLTGLVSDMSEMKRLIAPEIKIPPHDFQKLITFGSLTFCLPDPQQPTDVVERVDAIHTRLEKQSQILSTLTGLVFDMSKMKRLITEPPEIKILPLHIQEEIMKRLPVKSLVRFRSVSRYWKSLIESSEFIRTHKNQPQHLLVGCCDERVDKMYVSFPDNDSFPRMSSFVALPPSISQQSIVGTSYGLFCFHCYGKKMVVICNPCIRKSIAIDVPQEFYDGGDYDKFFGFGVCPVTLDPKILHITHLCPLQARRGKPESYKQFGKFWKVNVYKLSSGKFTILSSNLPGVSIRISRSWTKVVIDRHIYWLAEVDRQDGSSRNLVMSFDITDEKFKPVALPDTLASLNPCDLSLSKLRESLVMLEYKEDCSSCGVWKMNHGLFTKLFTIKVPSGSISITVLGFRKTGGPIMELYGFTFRTMPQIVAYDESNSRRCNVLIPGRANSYDVESYMETLLLIGRSDSTSF